MYKKYVYVIIIVISVLLMYIVHEKLRKNPLEVLLKQEIKEIGLVLINSTYGKAKEIILVEEEAISGFKDLIVNFELTTEKSNLILIGSIQIDLKPNKLAILELFKYKNQLLIKYGSEHYISNMSLLNFCLRQELPILQNVNEVISIELIIQSNDYFIEKGKFISKNENLKDLIDLLKKLRPTNKGMKLDMCGELKINVTVNNAPILMEIGKNIINNKIVVFYNEEFYTGRINLNDFFTKL